jgi:phage shock protein PspC (stress-responsive transcriptional regulator)
MKKSGTDKVISGVCGGIAETMGIDSIWVRLAFVCGFFMYGIGVLPYVVLWLLMPKADA